MDTNAIIQSASATLVAVAWKVAGALVLWLVGRWLIGFATRLVGRALADRLARIPNVLSTPAPDVDVLPAGPLLCVRPYCSNKDYWQVYFDTNRLIRETFGEAGFPAPMPAYAVSSPFPAPPLAH